MRIPFDVGDAQAVRRGAERRRRRAAGTAAPAGAAGGRPGELAAFTDPEARTVLARLEAAAPTWRNGVADRDTAGSTTLALRAAEEAPHTEPRRYPVGHFDVYVGAALEAIVADEVAFLCTHLLGSGRDWLTAQVLDRLQVDGVEGRGTLFPRGRGVDAGREYVG